MAESIRWGIMSTANIARGNFLPSLRAAGGGRAVAVASRDLARAEAWAAENGVERAVLGYDALLDDEEIDAIYNPLPNTLHAEWTIAALRAGKTVLCEKPLATSVTEAEQVLATAEKTDSLLWESFVFPFHRQMRRVWELLRSGAVGELREVQANFFFAIRDRGNIRLAPDLYGGSLNDVGCYCLRLAQLVFEAAPEEALATAVLAPEGVDEEMHGVIRYAGNRHLTFACGLNRRYDASARLLGTEGEIRLSNPFHPNLRDTLELRQTDRETVEHLGEPGATFTPAIAHIHAALRGEEEPRHTALDDSLATAQALAMVHAAAGSPFVPAIAHS